jgi:hypothetical protein
MAGRPILQIWHGALHEHMAGGWILQIWLALRAWGLRPSTPRSAGARVLAVSGSVSGAPPPHPQGLRQLRTWCQANEPARWTHDWNTLPVWHTNGKHFHGFHAPKREGVQLDPPSKRLQLPRVRRNVRIRRRPGGVGAEPPTHFQRQRAHDPAERGVEGRSPQARSASQICSIHPPAMCSCRVPCQICSIGLPATCSCSASACQICQQTPPAMCSCQVKLRNETL